MCCWLSASHHSLCSPGQRDDLIASILSGKGHSLIWGGATWRASTTPISVMPRPPHLLPCLLFACYLHLSLLEVTPTPLEELRNHKAMVKLQSRQDRDLRELQKKHQRKTVALTRRLLDGLAQARAEGRCRPSPGAP